MSEATMSLRRTSVIAVAASGTLNGLFVAASWWSGEPQGSDLLELGAAWLGFALSLLATGLAVLAIIGVAAGRGRKLAVHLLVVCVAWFATGALLRPLHVYVRWRALVRAAGIGDAVGSAIHRYVRTKGERPRVLEDLMPDYIAAIPSPGLSRSSRFRYLSGRDAQDAFLSEWALVVEIRRADMRIDRLILLPEGGCPSAAVWGTRCSGVGRWAYVEE